MEKILCRDRDLYGNVIRTYEWNVISIAELIEKQKAEAEKAVSDENFDPYAELMKAAGMM